MLNNEKIADKLEKIKSTVTSYVYANMDEEFQTNMNEMIGSRAILRTTGGSKVTFESYRDYNGRFTSVETEGQVMGKPFAYNFCSSMTNDGTGTIFSGKYGIDFWNVGDDEKVLIIKPFRKFLGKKSYLFADKAIDEILPLIEQFSIDIKTITPDEKTKAHLKKQEDTSVETKVQEESVTLKRKFWEEQLLYLRLCSCSYCVTLDSAELNEEQSFKR